MTQGTLHGWERLRHGGLLLDPARLQVIGQRHPAPLSAYYHQELRRRAGAILNGDADISDFIVFVLERICNFETSTGAWVRGPGVSSEWSRRTPSGESIKPRHLWMGFNGGLLPVFYEESRHIGIGRSRRTASQVVQWLRAGTERLALLTNGRQWRLIFAGLDFDAWCEWDIDLWFEEGDLSPQVDALRTLIAPGQWTPAAPDQPAPLLSAILDSRKGQAELSAALGERVREAVELLVQAHGHALRERCSDVIGAEIYRAAVRVVMRMVVILFAESRDLLPRDNALYHRAYGIGGLLEELSKAAARGGSRLTRSFSAWPRLLALFRLVHQGSHHPALPVRAYGGELFAPADGVDGLSRALQVFETAAFDSNDTVFSDRDVHNMLEKISRTRVRMRQGRQQTWVTVPVDFSDLSSEYIGILYEGLLDFELKTAADDDSVIFLAVGNQPALPLSRLEAMDDKELITLLEKMKDTSTSNDAEADGDADERDDAGSDADADSDTDDETNDENEEASASEAEFNNDQRNATRTRAEQWARRAVTIGKLVSKQGTKDTPDKRRAYEEAIAKKAHDLVQRVVLPGEWYLVRWGGTRKGSGTFYTRPGLAVPTVHRTLRPLAYSHPAMEDGTVNVDAPSHEWSPKRPEEILSLKTCDPACGSGTFPVATLRYLADALYASVHHHGRVADLGDQSVVSLLKAPEPGGDGVAALGQEMIPCRPDDERFEQRLKAVLKRYIVERCIYGVDLDPLAVELCRLSLWIETMDRALPFSFLDHKIKCGNGLVGAWFDQFLHYPVMAWKNREGGDKGHTNGVHFERGERSNVLHGFSITTLKDDLLQFLSGPTLFDPTDRAQEASVVHDQALELLNKLHDLPVHDAAERSRIYREELLASTAYQQLKNAMDLWCACWFWPAEAIAIAPLPSTLAKPSAATIAEAERIAAKQRFFHWELEFPDVFRAAGAGFDAILGNPPWETLQPNSKEYFSDIDPLYRTYGKQDALRIQTDYFTSIETEKVWIDYNASFASYSNWMKYAAIPFGDPLSGEAGNDRYTIARGKQNEVLHSRWRVTRAKTTGYADSVHPFQHRGEGKAYTYKLFLESAHALMRPGGRMGFIVPSGLYSDHGTGDLRRLFLDHCQWEWLFGFENRDKVFDIHRSFKFNPVIITKGGTTSAIRTAFMRRKLEDWEHAEEYATLYTRAQVDQFSPRSQAILEIQSKRDLEILEKIYANSVLLGDDGPNGWGVKYAQGDFNMTSDSHLFPPRTKWEEKGYRPDEYSRWLKGDWRPIEELWSELGIDPTHVVPNSMELEDWLFDSTAGPERRTAEAQFVHGHLLKPGDVARTNARMRCAQPPYDALPIPRAYIPAGIILSRNADAWIHEDRIEDVALPLYEGRMIGQFDFSQKGWVSGKGRSAVWRDIPWNLKVIEPQFLISKRDYLANSHCIYFPKLAHMRVGSATNRRSAVACQVSVVPTSDTTAIFYKLSWRFAASLAGVFNSFVFDYITRKRLVGLHLDHHVFAQNPLPRHWSDENNVGCKHASMLASPGVNMALSWYPELLTESQKSAWRKLWALTQYQRERIAAELDAIAFAQYDLDLSAASDILLGCDHPIGEATTARFDPKGFWRVDKDKDPELRHTVLTLIAFHNLETKIREHGGDRNQGIEAFLSQNNGEGWMIPETLRLADFGLGHDERALVHQPVAGRLGPRFYDWQLTQTAVESWRECHLHARNMLGAEEYQRLLDRIEAEKRGEVWQPQSLSNEPQAEHGKKDDNQQQLF
ncbi:MAG: hypothetical protein FGM32_08130 [Candidatus Kapabacteria bacterium]|nr:hypothetical protein [Candidatus Kapabacteria bacterium]